MKLTLFFVEKDWPIFMKCHIRTHCDPLPLKNETLLDVFDTFPNTNLTNVFDPLKDSQIHFHYNNFCIKRSKHPSWTFKWLPNKNPFPIFIYSSKSYFYVPIYLCANYFPFCFYYHNFYQNINISAGNAVKYIFIQFICNPVWSYYVLHPQWIKVWSRWLPSEKMVPAYNLNDTQLPFTPSSS